MKNWILALLSLITGAAIGLLYGWKIDPVDFVDTTPSSLRSDYRTDYVLMVAEAFHGDRNAEAAQQRLAVFGGEPAASICEAAIESARVANYAPSDLALLQDLARAMKLQTDSTVDSNGAP